MTCKGWKFGVITMVLLGVAAIAEAQTSGGSTINQLAPEDRASVIGLMHTFMPPATFEGLMQQVREEMFTQVNDFARRQNKSLPSDASERMQRAVRNSVSYEEIVILTAEAYMKHFSPDEIRQIAYFYNTPVGRKLARVQPEIMGDIMPKITNNINARVLEAMRKEGLVVQTASSQ
ncbi:MAG TPA: DUF2059 domain-containing protein [Terriglobales bacterium]|jgi:hypothetical protein|nr:DUF2059 domain-containing protein [Terriglobales bacterium]